VEAEFNALVAQRLGKERWYSHYELRVAKVERAYAGPEGRRSDAVRSRFGSAARNVARRGRKFGSPQVPLASAD